MTAPRPARRLLDRRLTRALVSLAALVAVVVAVVLGADPGGAPAEQASAPTPRATVSPEEFCTGFVALATVGEAALTGRSAFVDAKAVARRVRTLADGIEIPGRARAGLDYVVGTFLSLPDDTTPEQLAAADAGSSIDDSADADALGAWLAETCPT